MAQKSEELVYEGCGIDDTFADTYSCNETHCVA